MAPPSKGAIQVTDTIKDEEYQAKERNIGKGHQCLAKQKD